MVLIKEIVNCIFSSKSYIKYKEDDIKVWLIDIGDIEPVKEFC